MQNFSYVNATSIEQVPSLLGRSWDDAVVMAGGTDLVGEMKDYAAVPKRVVNLKSIEGLDYIRQDDAGMRIGALTTLTDVLDNGAVSQEYPVLHQAVSVIASPQIRNMATLAGNILQRPRCWYYRSEDFPCLKKGGARCYAVGGVNTYHAIFGSGPSYIVHPSDAAPALMALGASVNIHGPRGANEVAMDDFFTMPEMNIRRENILRPNEIVTEITIPKPEANSKGMFLKVRERESIDFALVSLAAQMTVVNGTCERASLVLGGVAPVPWRALEAEDYLRGRRITEARAESAAEAAVEDAAPMPHNGYKVEIAKNLVKQAVQALAA
ncbi:MAG: xanthine dehydrogenase family protein subunit M [Gemmatimonadetes bacterium]|nr:xanthine dehydrogenase family protein subunit M [Gemmatimonadota bacterium]MYA76779.1 xanthine dehydrogenase family protein subunit M [Gemmatimonadota bacterium]MYG17474.1 xanthine dehydrogenase family protein subunit M [Gemmatimonadota bacterium]MYH20343.1 xanthine dehydrogenase family protein subunit M [Gemmatimonadota bacterium]